jgi:hypothetical protein
MKRLAVSRKAYKGYKTFSAVREVIKESGDVNPMVLIKKIRGVWAVKDLALAVKLGFKGKLTITQPANPGVSEIRQIIEVMEEKK